MDVLTENGDALAAPAELTIREAESLRADLLNALQERGGTVTLDMGNVEQIDTAALQVLLAARGTARDLGGGLMLRDPGDAFRAAAGQLGLAAALLGPTEEGRER